MQLNRQQKLVKRFLLAVAFTPLLLINSSHVSAESSLPAATMTVTKQTSTAKEKLMVKLAKIAFFSANFTQKIINNQGELLQQGSGILAISKPNLINWQTHTPDETLIVSDGNTLWFFDPFIEQASAYSLAKSIHNTPILLLTSDEATLWQQYDVVQEGQGTKQGDTELEQRFVVTPKDVNSQIMQLTLTFSRTDNTSTDVLDNDDMQLSQFSFQDTTGQKSQISLNNFNNTVKPAASLFTFTLPQGVRLEDKR